MFSVFEENELYRLVDRCIRKQTLNNSIFCSFCEVESIIKSIDGCKFCPNTYLVNSSHYFLQDKILIDPLSKELVITGCFYNIAPNSSFSYENGLSRFIEIKKYRSESTLHPANKSIVFNDIKNAVNYFENDKVDWNNVVYFFDNNYNTINDLSRLKLSKRMGFTSNIDNKCTICIFCDKDRCKTCNRKSSVWVDIPKP